MANVGVKKQRHFTTLFVHFIPDTFPDSYFKAFCTAFPWAGCWLCKFGGLAPCNTCCSATSCLGAARSRCDSVCRHCFSVLLTGILIAAWPQASFKSTFWCLGVECENPSKSLHLSLRWGLGCGGAFERFTPIFSH